MKSIVDIVAERAPIGEKGRTINSLYIRARFVYNALANFIASADQQITDEHVDDSNTSNSQLVLTPQEKMVIQFRKSFQLTICSFLEFSNRCKMYLGHYEKSSRYTSINDT
jgi:hypothetical protein